MQDPRTIVLFCLKRSGTTAIYRAFRDHPAVSIPHADQSLDLWEPNFWNFAQQALEGQPERFTERWTAACPFLGPCRPQTEAQVFQLWDRIAEHCGPILFDKTPSLILPGRGLALLLRYRDLGRDVRFLAVVRDPRDVIASQFLHWGHLDPDSDPPQRERVWVEGYENLESLQKRLDIKLFRYEDLATDPRRHMPQLFAHCGLEDSPQAYRHLRPVNIGRHRHAQPGPLAAWSPGPRMRRLMSLHGYPSGALATLPA